MTQTKNIMPKHYQQLQSFERGQIVMPQLV